MNFQRLVKKFPNYMVKRMFTVSDLPETHKLLQRTYREFANKELIPKASILEFPTDEVKKLTKIGLLSLIAPEDEGGSGLGYLAYAITMEEISHGCAF